VRMLQDAAKVRRCPNPLMLPLPHASGFAGGFTVDDLAGPACRIASAHVVFSAQMSPSAHAYSTIAIV
jgi:hypothetical protein